MTVVLLFYIVNVAEEQAGNDGDGWIDTTRGRTAVQYDDEDEECSSYFSSPTKQGQKRKKAPFFKYSKKKKSYGNTSTNSKGSVVYLFHDLLLKTKFSFKLELFINFSLRAVLLLIQSWLQQQ